MSNFPSWLKVRTNTVNNAAPMARMRSILQRHHLVTVCQGANCPNAAECWGNGTATFMLLGDTCTRACRFCAVSTGNPHGVVDLGEPERIAEAVCDLELSHVVLTSVDRDDLKDGGASVIAQTIEAIKTSIHSVTIEALIPDFAGSESSLDAVVQAHPEIIGHNIETVERLSAQVRDPRASYRLSLEVLSFLSQSAPNSLIKSSLMLGLGENDDEIVAAFKDLRDAGVDSLTLGQYLQPNSTLREVSRYIPPAEFNELRDTAINLGFSHVSAGPFVRSSYNSAEQLETR